jgi:hypothetical protein
MAFVFGASCVQLGGHNELAPTTAPSTGTQAYIPVKHSSEIIFYVIGFTNR